MIKKLTSTISLLLIVMFATAADIKGVVKDSETKEPLIGASVQIDGTTVGTITDLDGSFVLNGVKGETTIVVSYVSYITKKLKVNASKDTAPIEILLEPDNRQLGEVTVTARKNNETATALLKERQKSSIPIENIGARDLSIKGISDVQEGVKKLTGISVASAGQIIVRGLGDRYSITTLNGMSVASPNPDHKLIPLDLFPTSTVKNITVSKVYDVASFADYSGAHIDIATKDQSSDNFFEASVSVKGYTNTIGGDFYEMDRASTLFRNPSIDNNAYNLPLSDFRQYSRNNRIFNTGFNVERRTAIPAFSGNVSFGRNFRIGSNDLNILASMSVSNGLSSMDNAIYKTLEATGTVVNDFNYDAYINEVKLSGLASVGYSFRESDHIGYNFFYARNASNEYMTRSGHDRDDHQLLGIHDVTHIYTLQNHQLSGFHEFGDAWSLTWKGSYGKTTSEEPDRRQVMYERTSNGLELFKLNRQETMRYFGDLNESEYLADVSSEYKFGESNKVVFGAAYKDKKRSYSATRFYYNLSGINPVIDDFYRPDDFINAGALAAGDISVNRVQQLKDNYEAANRIAAGFISAELYPVNDLMINIGVRYEYSDQYVDYYDDASIARRSTLKNHDFFPALNARYQFRDNNSIRLSFSRTITRPSFIEMTPFLYQESYGGAQIRGNEHLKNGYNWNVDLRYEYITQSGDMFSATVYYKQLEDPIERTQFLQGGATTHSFNNADNGVAAGVEVEIRKNIVKDLILGANVSYMYTNVVLPEGGAYTNTTRALQGASPYLANADLTYAPKFKNGDDMSLALLYNLQGPRIQSVGVSGLGDVTQQALHTLNFVARYRFNEHCSISAKVNDILNRDVIFEQDVPLTGGKEVVERFKTGTNFEIGFTYKL
ncbi:MAG TPA: TonB-dependent receptor [Candidatus Avibacteroides avistercoris]|uniref:TonB-dependent receptor n=1 Tax=Candidatus Avibacteroides avistercoris TaxID=2840690 RepID=A0A9D2ZUB1_9BACT|nr:TonB-dependent receptor [Candidatus Avibacteroides avistercoris]